jgi:hypothetical protein
MPKVFISQKIKKRIRMRNEPVKFGCKIISNNSWELTRFGYKVVSKNSFGRGRHGSCMDPWSPRIVEYGVDKWSFPKSGCGPLAVFESFGSALEFICDRSNKMIFKCKFVCVDLNTLGCNALWDKKNKLKFFDLPPGTILAKRVMLLNRCHVRVGGN